ncbi:hypothetical protein C0995_008401 [Termitomyces sp. Mi166|nr:hypothetical protein C0995_008401 [Termitomyces sp. Mi166\
MSKLVDKEVKILQPPQIPGQHITIKEEALECSVPAGAENLQVIARRIPMVDSWNECINYQCMRNQDLRLRGRSLIDDQGVVFEGCSGVTPIDDMKRQFVARQECQERKEHPDNTGDSCENNNRNERCHGQHDRTNKDNGRPPGRCPEQPEPREPPALREERRAEESLHLVTRAWSLPSLHDLCATMPGMNMAVKLHMDHMHDHLNQLVDDLLGVRFKFPDGVKPHRAEGKHIWTYSGGHKFSQLEDWDIDVCYHLAACCYGGDNMDQERIFALHKFINGEAWNWFRCHVLHTNRDKQDWTFKEVLIGLYNRFVNVATMQEAQEAFQTAVYDAQTGVQMFYKELIGHAQNMAVYLDEFTIWETFLDGIPAEMRRVLICDDNLLPEVNTVTKFLMYAIKYKQSAHTAMHYDQRSSHRAQGHRQPVKVGTFLAKRSEMDQNHNPQFVMWHKLSPGQKPVQGPTGDTPVTNKNWHAPRAGQPVQKGQDGPPWVNPPRVSPSKVTFGGDARHKPSAATARCYNCDCKAPKVQLQAAHTAAADSNAESDIEEDQEELVKDEEVPLEKKDLEAEYDAESVHIDGDEYITVDVYDNEYYTREEDEEHLFALIEYQEDTRVQMQCVTLQKAADKLHRPQYTP